MKKRMLLLMIGMIMTTILVIGCGKQESEGGYVIGISQFAEHGSLDNCREGFIQGLAEQGLVEGENLTIDYKNAASEMGTASQIASGFVSDDVDLICAIATPSAQAAYNAAMDTKIPVIYTAITDPVEAELAAEDGTPVGKITGTSDKLPVDAQLKMIRDILPQAKKLGIIYTTSEANSLSAIEEYKEKVSAYGFELVTKGVTSVSEVGLATESILTEVDCITNLTDNTVVTALATILDKANQAKVPVFGSEIEQVKCGCLAAEGLDYVELGRKTGEMAAMILKGQSKAEEQPFEQISEASLYLNTKVAENLGIQLSEELVKEAAECYDSISE